MPNSQTSDATEPLIAIVDDDSSFLRSLDHLLRSSGFCARTFSSGISFVAALSTFEPSCVILDVQMPEMDGFAVREHLSAIKAYLPIIFITAHDTPQFRERARGSGIAGTLTKPFEPSSLLDILRRALSPPSR